MYPVHMESVGFDHQYGSTESYHNNTDILWFPIYRLTSIRMNELIAIPVNLQ
ncbi:MAG: hypothetical protein GY705_07150 [Bacteroidetes bacterium]|nr:hypothetical protein [Bacteroidota bacterium]